MTNRGWRTIRLGLAAAISAAVALVGAVSAESAAPIPPKIRMHLAAETLGPDVGELGAAARIRGRVRVRTGDLLLSERPVITGGRVFLPKAIALNGGHYQQCDPRNVRVPAEGYGDCRDRSLVGKASLDWGLGVPITSINSVDLFNAGTGRIWAFATILSPAIVQEPVELRIARLHRQRWGHRLSFRTPKILQLVAGQPVEAPPDLELDIGGRPWARKYISLRGGCPKRGYLAFKVSFNYRFHSDGSTGTLSRRERLNCDQGARVR